jgi:hypothetical protein
MKTKIAVLCCLTVGLLVAGCGPSSPGSIAPVSGKLTLDGKPLPGVEIVFSPLEVEGASNPGPWSAATTDAEGNYTMKTRYKENGAVIGLNHVTMSYDDLEPGAMEELHGELADAKSSEDEPEKIKAQIAELKKKLKGRAIIPASAERDYEVPPGGNKNLNFELTSEN